MQKEVNNYGNYQKTVQQQSLDEVLLADQNQGGRTDFFMPAQPDYNLNEQDQEEFVNEFLNEGDDFLSGHRENPCNIKKRRVLFLIAIIRKNELLKRTGNL